MIKASFFSASFSLGPFLSLELEAVEGTDRWPRADLDARGHLRFPCGKVAVAREGVLSSTYWKFLDPGQLRKRQKKCVSQTRGQYERGVCLEATLTKQTMGRFLTFTFTFTLKRKLAIASRLFHLLRCSLLSKFLHAHVDLLTVAGLQDSARFLCTRYLLVTEHWAMSATVACQMMQCRVPRLAVRNPTSDTNPSSSEDSHESHRQEEHHHASEDGMSVGPGQAAQESCRMVHQKEQHQRTESSHQQDEKSKSTTKSSSSSSTSLKSKTAANALSFFTLKEPSTAAWHDFAAAQEKQKTKRRILASQQQQRQHQQHNKKSFEKEISPRRSLVSLARSSRSSSTTCSSDDSTSSGSSSQKTRTGKSLFRIF